MFNYKKRTLKCLGHIIFYNKQIYANWTTILQKRQEIVNVQTRRMQGLDNKKI